MTPSPTNPTNLTSGASRHPGAPHDIPGGHPPSDSCRCPQRSGPLSPVEPPRTVLIHAYAAAMQDAPRYDATQPVPVTPAGWYPLNGELRYWDGAHWTEHRASAPAPLPPAPPQVVHHHYAPAPTFVTDARVSALALV